MILLYQPPGAWGLPSLSPFCVKLEAYLRMSGQAYEVRPAHPMKAPKGKMPYVDLGGGRLMGDSQLIIEHLEHQSASPLDAGLAPADRALGHAVRRMLEESIYWNLVHERWATELGWSEYRPIFLALMPPVIGGLMLPMLRKRVVKSLHAQGLGRHRPEEIDEMGRADMSALSELLGDKPYLLGDTPRTFDASVYGFVSGVLAFPRDTPLKRHTQAQDNLVRYAERFRARVFADGKPASAPAA